MVTKITSPHRVVNALNYNEHKVKKGQAECLFAGNFIQDVTELSFARKLHRFIRLQELNQRTQKTHTLHISLNFHPSERFTREQLIQMGIRYMEEIGFAKQPYLIYEHRDAAHPHLHIITSTIKADGGRIDSYRIGKTLSEPARQKLEMEFGLVKAAGRNSSEKGIGQTRPAEKAIYGKSETKRSITNVLDWVIEGYAYVSLPELNAVLKEFNVYADPGVAGGRVHRFGGLHYRLLDDQGSKIGVPIKASNIYSRPTLARLEVLFERNRRNKSSRKTQVRQAVIQSLGASTDWSTFTMLLQQRKISIRLIENAGGRKYGVLFVDHDRKVVFKGSDLAKDLSLKGIEQRFQPATSINSDPKVADERGKIDLGKNMVQQTGIKATENVRKQAALLNLLQDDSAMMRLSILPKKKRRKRKATK